MHDITHLTSLNALGAVAGGLGVIIAVYLQFVTDRRVPARYHVAYFLFGAILLFGNAAAVPLFTDAEIELAAYLGVALSVVGQLVGFVWLVKHEYAESPTEVAESLVEQTDEVLNGNDS